MTKKTIIITLIAVLGLMTACNDDITTPTYTVGAADNAIVLSAGISEGGAGVMTRAAGGYDDIDATNHTKHLPFTSGTKAAIRIDGTWKGKTNGSYTKGNIIKGTINSEVVSQTTTATIKSETSSDSKHNAIEFSSAEQLYWDDYGTADPNNMPSIQGNGREIGLTIYSVAVDGETSAPTIDGSDGKSWTALSWNVGTPGDDVTIDQSNATNYWRKHDLLISNNVKVGDLDDTYKFDERSSGKLLEFTHAMSKITVRLIADEGFPTSGSGLTGKTNHKFENAPEVKLTSNVTGETNPEWAMTTCSVNIETGVVTSPNAPASITMHQGTVVSADEAKYTAIYDALIAPGSVFGANTSGDPIVYNTIARINADGNVYYVTSEMIRAAITTKYGSGNENGFATQPGVNYVLTVRVKKTEIEVTATIKDWESIEAETVQPVININAQVGAKGNTGSLTAFDFYMSTSHDVEYTNYGNATGTADGTTKWQFKDGSTDISLFWPTHNTHYFMRGVSPKSTAIDDKKQIVVANAAYDATTSPSNLMIGAPEIAENTMCGSTDHTQVDMSESGICARNNSINLNFRYVMSQVEVRLKSTGTDEKKNKVTIDANTTVEIIGGYGKGRILLGSRLHDTYTDEDKSTSYSMHTSSATVPAGFSKVMHDIIVPQTLTNDMQFKITVKNADASIDVYFAQLNKIKVKTTDDSEELITEWKPGEHYIYELDIVKTEVNITATLTDWIPVEAEEDVWF